MLHEILLSAIAAGLWTPAGAITYSKIVETNFGPIRGEVLRFEGTTYQAFKGIPYAAPPLRNLRFKGPEPPQKWDKVRDAITYGNSCTQPHRPSSSEDCLYLNVYTPSLGENVSKPVLVWIHGGAYMYGDSYNDRYGPEYLVQQDIVAVAMNYRLGPLGFLATNTSDATGNWAMKDQVAALKWVQANIAQFGGDPNQVTIYGHSAGASSVHLHTFSPLSKGLFRYAIVASGSAVNDWALKNAHQQVKFSKNMARVLGASESEIEDPAKRIQFLREADSKAMVDQIPKVLGEEDNVDPFMDTLPFTPVIETSNAEEAFLIEDPKKLLSEGKFAKVPMMIGVNDLEGGIAFSPVNLRNVSADARREVEKKLCNYLPDGLKDGIIAKNDCLNVTQQIRDVYFDGKTFDSSLLNFIYLHGDVFMVKDIHLSQRLHAHYADKDIPLYNFYFTFDGQWNAKKIADKIPLPGATHGDLTPYVFVPMIPLPNLPASSPEVITKNRIISFITNFVKQGDPTPTVSDIVPIKWEPAKENESNIMFIGNELKLEKGFLKARMELWDQLYKNYGTSEKSR